ncbi:MAG TPA: hypothetical protein ENI87_14145 [bacterium]|nr:hypothetical protein [bacterium]
MRPFFLGTLFTIAAAVGQDPVPPPGGFGVTVTTHAVTWSDGYQSMMDLYVPVAPPPASGWPGVLAVHGGQGTRSIAYIAQAGYYLAKAGYVVYAYDVRGNPTTLALNPGVPVAEELQLTDSAESHALANAFSGGIIDPSRLAVTGFSEGAVHAYEAAAWSGKPIPPYYTTVYPPIQAVYGRNHSPDRVGSTLPHGRLIKAKTAVGMYTHIPAWFALLQAGDYAGLEAAMLADPQTNFYAELLNSTVAVFAQIAWYDSKQHPNEIIDSLNGLPATTPWKLFLSTDGHNSPTNLVEIDRKHDLRRQWFDRHVKGLSNQIDLAPRVEAALAPSDPATQLATTSHWPHRYANVWPPATPTSTWYLRTNSALSTTAPSANETGPMVSNAPIGGFDLVAFAQANGWNAVNSVLQSLPLDRELFDAPPLAQPREIFGRPHVDIWVDATAGDFQVTVALYKVDPAGTETFLGLGTDAVRGASAGRHQLGIDLMDMGVTVDAGDRLRLVVENLSLQNAPGYQRIRFLPEFNTYDLTIVMEPGFESRLLLPSRVRSPGLTPAIAERSLGNGFTHQLTTTSSPQLAGHAYLTVLGVSGSWPGTPLSGTTMPVNWDVFSDVGLTLAGTPNPWLTGFAGTLDPQGGAQHQLLLDPLIGPLFVGARMTFATLTLDPTAPTPSYRSTAAADLLIVP